MPVPGSATQRSPLFSRQQVGGFWSLADIEAQPNNIWCVHSGRGTDGVGYGRNPDAPFASLDYAVSHGDIATGDTIYLFPGIFFSGFGKRQVMRGRPFFYGRIIEYQIITASLDGYSALADPALYRA